MVEEYNYNDFFGEEKTKRREDTRMVKLDFFFSFSKLSVLNIY